MIMGQKYKYMWNTNLPSKNLRNKILDSWKQKKDTKEQSITITKQLASVQGQRKILILGEQNIGKQEHKLLTAECKKEKIKENK
jgi:hypothetical protein